MDVFEASQHLVEVQPRLVLGQPAVLVEHLLDTASGQVFEVNDASAVDMLSADVLHNVRVVKPLQYFNFLRSSFFSKQSLDCEESA